MDAVYYFGSLLLGLGILALEGIAVLFLIEIGYRIYIKLTGKDY